MPCYWPVPRRSGRSALSIKKQKVAYSTKGHSVKNYTHQKSTRYHADCWLFRFSGSSKSNLFFTSCSRQSHDMECVGFSTCQSRYKQACKKVDIIVCLTEIFRAHRTPFFPSWYYYSAWWFAHSKTNSPIVWWKWTRLAVTLFPCYINRNRYRCRSEKKGFIRKFWQNIKKKLRNFWQPSAWSLEEAYSNKLTSSNNRYCHLQECAAKITAFWKFSANRLFQELQPSNFLFNDIWFNFPLTFLSSLQRFFNLQYQIPSRINM